MTFCFGGEKIYWFQVYFACTYAFEILVHLETNSKTSHACFFSKTKCAKMRTEPVLS